MYAIVETGGKQYMAKVGETLYVEKLDVNEGATVNLKVVAVSTEAGLKTGDDAGSVTAKVVGHGKSKKIIVYKYKAKKDYRRKQGHRQPYTKIMIETIN